MQYTIDATSTRGAISGRRIGWGLSGLAILFLIFDGGIKVLQLREAVEGSAALGFSAGETAFLGILTLACLLVYTLPRTAPLGAVLLTGYLGGAVAVQLSYDAPLFSLVFPFIIGGLLWAGLALRDDRWRAVLLPR